MDEINEVPAKTRPRVLLISAGLTHPKKTDHPAARKHRYLNYGLLTLASILQDHGYSARLVHGQFMSPGSLAAELVEAEKSASMLLLSLPSSYAMDWAREFIEHIREDLPQLPIVVGGRWVVKTDGEWVRERLPGVDLVVYGLAEGRILQIVQRNAWPMITGTNRSPHPLDTEAPSNIYQKLHYSLMDNFREYHPSLEVSRGCGRGCSFCEEKNLRLSPLRGVDNLTEAVKDAIDLYEDSFLRFYFEASWFAPDRHWANRFAKSYGEAGLSATWRCETRVDVIQRETLELLAAAGLRVIDLGLESASPNQLSAMKKTHDPLLYLRNASEVLKACRDVGIWAKVNVLLYAGENIHTLSETLDWLEDHRDCIKGVSAGPLVVYGRGKDAADYLQRLSEVGATPVDPSSSDREGYAQMNLSPSMDHASANQYSISIAKSFMTDRDYYDLKAFTYLPRGYTFEDFQKDGEYIDEALLPFSLT